MTTFISLMIIVAVIAAVISGVGAFLSWLDGKTVPAATLTVLTVIWLVGVGLLALAYSNAEEERLLNNEKRCEAIGGNVVYADDLQYLKCDNLRSGDD